MCCPPCMRADCAQLGSTQLARVQLRANRAGARMPGVAGVPGSSPCWILAEGPAGAVCWDAVVFSHMVALPGDMVAGSQGALRSKGEGCQPVIQLRTHPVLLMLPSIGQCESRDGQSQGETAPARAAGMPKACCHLQPTMVGLKHCVLRDPTLTGFCAPPRNSFQHLPVCGGGV